MVDRAADNVYNGNSDPLYALKTIYLRENGFIKHHIESYNKLVSPNQGISHMVTNLFKIVEEVPYTMGSNPTIVKLQLLIKFVNCTIKRPEHSRENQILPCYPHVARNERTSYLSPIKTDVIIELKALDKDGNVVDKKIENIDGYEFGQIPAMVKSDVCNLHGLSPTSLQDLNEDPSDIGGYFIVNGREYVICSAESIQYNMEHIHNNMYKEEISRGIHISRAGDISEHSYQLIIRYLNTKEITFEITYSYMKAIQIPFYILFRIFGVINDKDIINFIVSDSDSDDPLIKSLVGMLAESMLYAKIGNPMFASLQFTRNPKEILKVMNDALIGKSEQMAQSSQSTMKMPAKTDKAAPATTATNTQKLKNYRILTRLDEWLLPHIGSTSSSRIDKLRDIGVMIYNLLLVTLKIKMGTNKESYQNKRIQAPGHVMTAPIRKTFNNTIILPVRMAFRNRISSTAFANISLRAIFVGAIRTDDFTNMIIKAIQSGSSELTLNGRKVSESIPAQVLEYKNKLFVMGTMRTILPTTRVNNGGKSLSMRAVDSSYPGFICLAQSAETGDRVGKIKQMAIYANITVGFSDQSLIHAIRNDPDVVQLSKISGKSIFNRGMHRVRVNGLWVGVTSLNVNDLAAKYRHKRRFGEINIETTIYVDQSTQELYFWTDAGRMLRPVLIVVDTPHGRDIALTNAMLGDLIAGKIGIYNLMTTGVLEYIGPDEQDNTYIATSYEELRVNSHNPTKLFTHCEMPESILGIIALLSPAGHHTNAIRVSYMTGHAKQACGIPQLSWPFTQAKHLYVQYNIEMPLVKTIVNDHIYPNGSNLIIAYMSNDGRGQEDACCGNKSAFDRGLMSLFYYTCELIEIKANEEVRMPMDSDRVDNPHHQGNTSKLDSHGVIKIDSVVNYNDVLVSKYVKNTKETGVVEYKYNSALSKFTDKMRVVRVIRGKDKENNEFIRIVFYAHKPISCGDKISSREGNKSILTEIMTAADMPFTTSGLIPDIIISPHSFSKRMILGQPIEAIMEKICAAKGTLTNATSFCDINFEAIIEEANKLGLYHGGKEKMMYGQTGKSYITDIFICPTFYQRLQKFADNQMHAVSRTRNDPITRQPIKGKKNNGGARIGEMEKDALCAYGAGQVMFEKFNLHSDGADIPFCYNCGVVALYNERANLYICNFCKYDTHIVKVKASWIQQLLATEMQGCHIGMKYEFEKLSFRSGGTLAAPPYPPA